MGRNYLSLPDIPASCAKVIIQLLVYVCTVIEQYIIAQDNMVWRDICNGIFHHEQKHFTDT